MNLTQNEVKIALDYLIDRINEAGKNCNFSITSDEVTSVYIKYLSFTIDVRTLDESKQEYFGSLLTTF